MRDFLMTTSVLLAFVSANALAANVTVKWVGVVPASGCAANPVSNQTDFETLSRKCQSELKLEQKHLNKQTTVSKNIVSFDV
ncbi:hypothetical protein ACNO5M_27025 [Vibrio owensii]|uniref:hypothetical protein n=1 Tax=Vibrio owensii TaxID=696485 RepID=UPI003AB04F11